MSCEFKVGDKVDSVGGILQDGIVKATREVSNFTLLTIEWPDGRVEDRSSRIVRKGIRANG